MKNRVLGSALIIAGTAVGAGMLAMPLTSAKMGFSLTFLLLLLLWILLTYTALLYAEVHQYDKNDAGLASLTERYFGKIGRLFVNFILLFFMYTVLIAYVTGSGDLLFKLLPKSLELAPDIARKIVSLIFAVSFGIAITLGIGVADITNRIAFSLKVIAFIIILYLLFNKISIVNLQSSAVSNLVFFSAMPVFFMTFGFHICTPTINEYLQGNNKKVRLACILGSTGIFIIYLLWQIATHGVLEQSQLLEILDKEPNLDGLISAFEISSGSKLISELVRIFSVLALITSYIGVALGLGSAVKDLLAHFNFRRDPIIVGLITFVPPIIVGFTYPGIFLSAFAFAGIIFAFIGVILPVALAYKSRKANPKGDHIWGGNTVLGISIVFAVVIVAAYFLADFGYLPHVVAS